MLSLTRFVQRAAVANLTKAPVAFAPRFFSTSGDKSKGVVKWFDAAKGFGFIVQDNGSDLFVHFTGIKSDGFRSLEEGQRVEFEVTNGTKGPAATSVNVLGRE